MIAVIAGTIAIVAAVIAVGVLVDRKIGLLPRPEELRDSAKPKTRLPASYAPGEAPATAIRTTPQRLAKLRESQRCSACRGPMRAEDEADSVRFGDRELHVLRFHCTRCGTPRRLYIEPGE